MDVNVRNLVSRSGKPALGDSGYRMNCAWRESSFRREECVRYGDVMI